MIKNRPLFAYFLDLISANGLATVTKEMKSSIRVTIAELLYENDYLEFTIEMIRLEEESCMKRRELLKRGMGTIASSHNLRGHPTQSEIISIIAPTTLGTTTSFKLPSHVHQYAPGTSPPNLAQNEANGILLEAINLAKKMPPLQTPRHYTQNLSMFPFPYPSMRLRKTLYHHRKTTPTSSMVLTHLLSLKILTGRTINPKPQRSYDLKVITPCYARNTSLNTTVTLLV